MQTGLRPSMHARQEAPWRAGRVTQAVEILLLWEAQQQRPLAAAAAAVTCDRV